MPESKYKIQSNRKYWVSKQAADKVTRSLKTSLKNARQTVKEYKAPAYALGNSALMLAGAGAAGVVRAYQPTIGNLPTDMALALVSITAGVALKKTHLVYLGSGMASAFVGGYTQEMAERYFYGQGSTAVPNSAVG